MTLKYGIIGSGAIGGYCGGKLAKAGKDVHFLFHSDYEFVKSNGLQIDSVDGDFHLSEVNAYRSTKDMPKCDIVLVCLKSTNNGLLKEMLTPLLHKNTIVILIQNGIGLESDLQEVFPDLNLAGGLAFICASKNEPGRINHQSLGKINIGAYSCSDISLLEEAIKDLNESGIDTKLVDYEEARWKKAVWNIPFNGMTVVLNTTTDQLVNNPATEKLLREMMIEVIEAAQHAGVKNIDSSLADKTIEMTKVMPPYSPSMKLDYDFKRPMEIKYLYSRSIEEAKKNGYDMVKAAMLEKQLLFIESQYLK
ncbi:2-dehydropantoate 2-reductase [Prevotella sp.]|uniref:2-dehydropantoate 2-reductase n=1 Tax=Prevotella sp. TaxID=59823 RepID=UPI003DA39367